MVFSSTIFLFVFLPIFLAVYYLTPFRWRSLVILIGSYSFYAWWRVDFLLLFVAVTLWNYTFGIVIHNYQYRKDDKVVKRTLAVGVAGNLATLGFFKYANFGIDSFNALLTSVGQSPMPLADIILPIGISFYIFQI